MFGKNNGKHPQKSLTPASPFSKFSFYFPPFLYYFLSLHHFGVSLSLNFAPSRPLGCKGKFPPSPLCPSQTVLPFSNSICVCSVDCYCQIKKTSRHHRPSSSSTNLTVERKSFFTGAVQNPFRGSLVVCVGDLASLGFDGVCAVGEWVVVGLIVGYCGFQMRRTGMVCCGFLFVCEEGIKNDLVLGCRG